MLPVLIVVAGLLVSPAVVDFVRRPDLRRVSVRNIGRRLGEAGLVVLGSALGTAIIAAALIIGDTFEKSVLDIARTRLGPIDELVFLDDGIDSDPTMAALTEPPLPGVDGVLAVAGLTASLTNADATNAMPNVNIGGIDLTDAASFGTDPSIRGVPNIGADLAIDEAIVNSDVAEELDIAVGDKIVGHAFGQELVFTVVAIADAVGLAGFSPVVVSPAVIATAANVLLDGARPPWSMVLVSNTGGVFDSVDDRAAVEQLVDTIGSRLDAVDIGHTVSDEKRNLIDGAQAEEDEITEIFTVVGGFSVLAGPSCDRSDSKVRCTRSPPPSSGRSRASVSAGSSCR